MAHYYNEIETFAAEWLRNLIKAGHLPDGEVDTRSIVDVQPADLAGFTQCHFFAGIGGWPLAIRNAGWPDDRPIWSGSCPCQPFSVAGKGGGTDDPRHLWPHFFRLISAARPPVAVGEQVAGAAGYGWFDGIASDLATEGYASRAVDVPACSVDAPHIRSRLYWVAVRARMANTHRDGRGGEQASRLYAGGPSGHDADGRGGQSRGLDMADAASARRQDPAHAGAAAGPYREAGASAGGVKPQRGGAGSGHMADTDRGATRQLAGELRGHEGQHDLGTAHGYHLAAADGRGGREGDVVYADHARLEGWAGDGHDRGEPGRLDQEPDRHAAPAGGFDGRAGHVADTSHSGWGEEYPHARWGGAGDRAQGRPAGSGTGGADDMADPDLSGPARFGGFGGSPAPAGQLGHGPAGGGAHGRNGTFWSDAVWLTGADGKARRAGSDVRRMVDELPGWLAGLRPDFYAEAIQEVTSHAEAFHGGAAEALRTVWEELLAEPEAFGSMGELSRVPAAQVLFPYLRQLASACDEAGVFVQGPEAAREELRSLLVDGTPARAPCERRPVQQQPFQPSNALHSLSWVLAQHAEAAWNAHRRQNARAIRLLAHGVQGRVGKLRALGNAIVPALAEEVVRALIETVPE